jgi:galactokinase
MRYFGETSWTMTTFEATRAHITHKCPDFFSPAEIIVSRAPGRIDLMGGIADYSGSLVLQWPIAAATHVALQLQDTPTLQIRSLPSDSDQQTRSFEMPLADLYSQDYASARALFQREPDRHWAAYVAGAFLVLIRERECVFKQGVRILISSDVPEGKGVSSSAALEVSTMTAIAAAYEIKISPIEIAFLSQKVENAVAGAPCGVMDQMTAACGESDRLLALLCQPGELQGTIKLPDELTIWGFDSGIRHSVAGADYGIVRTAAFMGQRIIAELGGLPEHGYLANLTPEEFDKNFVAHLPQQMSGKDFLNRYHGITDLVTSVDATKTYPVFSATKHPVYEHARVKLFAEVLRNWRGLRQANTLGELMYESHDSYSACGLGSSSTDELVRLVREVGPDGGLYGAKITGGGSGGTVAVLAHRSAGPAIEEIANQYAKRTGYQPMIISGSSPGAAQFGTLRL